MRNRVISGKTRICGIIGDPIEHSMSPVMHNAAFNQLGIDYLYVPFRVRKEELGKAVEGVRKHLFDMKIPQKLSNYNVNKEDIPVIASEARRYNFLNYVPRPISKDDLMNILMSAY